MPLDPTNFHPLGPVKSVDMMQFYNVLTGVMKDQPISLSNVVTIGGDQGVTSVPLKLYGAQGQNTNLIDLYPDKTSAQPTFGFSASGAHAWGPGGTAPQDTFMSRIGLQNGHAVDTPGLLIIPGLEVAGDIRVVGGDVIIEGGTVTGEFEVPPVVTLTRINWNPLSGGAFIQAYAGDGTYVHMPKLTVTPGTTALAGLVVNGNSTMNGVVQVNEALNATGVISGRYLSTSDGSNGVVQAGAGSIYIRPAANGAHVLDAAVATYVNTPALVVQTRVTVGGYDPGAGWPLATNGNGIAAGRFYQQGNGGAYCLDVTDSAVGVVGSKLVMRSPEGYVYASYINTTAGGITGGAPVYVAGQGGDGFLRWYAASAIGPPAANVAPLTVLTASRGNKGPLAVTCNRTGYWVAYAFGGLDQDVSGTHYEGDIFMDDEPSRMWRSHDGRAVIAIVWTTPRFRSAGQNINVNMTMPGGQDIGYDYGWTLYAVFVPTPAYPGA